MSDKTNDFKHGKNMLFDFRSTHVTKYIKYTNILNIIIVTSIFTSIEDGLVTKIMKLICTKKLTMTHQKQRKSALKLF